jgi:hypothetical protein
VSQNRGNHSSVLSPRIDYGDIVASHNKLPGFIGFPSLLKVSGILKCTPTLPESEYICSIDKAANVTSFKNVIWMLAGPPGPTSQTKGDRRECTNEEPTNIHSKSLRTSCQFTHLAAYRLHTYISLPENMFFRFSKTGKYRVYLI